MQKIAMRPRIQIGLKYERKKTKVCTFINISKLFFYISYVGPREVYMCAVAQYVNLWGTMVGYTITATISMG